MQNMTKKIRFGLVAVGLVLATSVSFALAGSAIAHTCETYGKYDADGCNAHSCPDDGESHHHVHNTAWNDWSQIDHYCTSNPTSAIEIDEISDLAEKLAQDIETDLA